MQERGGQRKRGRARGSEMMQPASLVEECQDGTKWQSWVGLETEGREGGGGVDCGGYICIERYNVSDSEGLRVPAVELATPT